MITTINEFRNLLILENIENTFEWDFTTPESEESNLDKLKRIISTFKKDSTKLKLLLKKYLNKFIDKLDKIELSKRTKIFTNVILICLTVLSVTDITNIINNKSTDNRQEYIEWLNSIEHDNTITYIDQYDNNDNKVHINKLKTSNINTDKDQTYIDKVVNQMGFKFDKKLINFIMHEEGDRVKKGEPVLTAYDLGDGKVTIGYGYSEDKSSTRMIPGVTKITKKEAIDLLLSKLLEFQKQVDYYLNKSKSLGYDFQVDKNMYNALISMTHNMGIGNLIKSSFYKHLINGEYRKAAERIKTTNISQEYPGLEKRRQQEFNLFIGKPVSLS